MDEEPLHSLVSISVGTPRTESDAYGEKVGFLQISDIDQFGRLIPNAPKMTTVADNRLSERAWTQFGDVLLANKGPRNVAVFYRHDYPKVIVSGAFYILRVTDLSTILPEFLACYLNLPTTQNQLQKKIVTASTVLTLNKKDLSDLLVSVPPLDIQQRLIDTHNAFLAIYDLSHQQLNHHQELLYQCFSTTLLPHRQDPANG